MLLLLFLLFVTAQRFDERFQSMDFFGALLVLLLPIGMMLLLQGCSIVRRVGSRVRVGVARERGSGRCGYGDRGWSTISSSWWWCCCLVLCVGFVHRRSRGERRRQCRHGRGSHGPIRFERGRRRRSRRHGDQSWRLSLLLLFLLLFLLLLLSTRGRRRFDFLNGYWRFGQSTDHTGAASPSPERCAAARPSLTIVIRIAVMVVLQRSSSRPRGGFQIRQRQRRFGQSTHDADPATAAIIVSGRNYMWRGLACHAAIAAAIVVIAAIHRVGVVSPTMTMMILFVNFFTTDATAADDDAIFSLLAAKRTRIEQFDPEAGPFAEARELHEGMVEASSFGIHWLLLLLFLLFLLLFLCLWHAHG